jgi:hypothetical protein
MTEAMREYAQVTLLVALDALDTARGQIRRGNDQAAAGLLKAAISATEEALGAVAGGWGPGGEVILP